MAKAEDEKSSVGVTNAASPHATARFTTAPASRKIATIVRCFFTGVFYDAGSRRQPRRAVIKFEVNDLGDAQLQRYRSDASLSHLFLR